MRYEIVEKVRGKRPLIHCITNYVTANDVANMILAAGASPIMAESAREAEEIAQISQALVLNQDIDAESGATISSKALLRAVNSAIEAYNAIP